MEHICSSSHDQHAYYPYMLTELTDADSDMANEDGDADVRGSSTNADEVIGLVRTALLVRFPNSSIDMGDESARAVR